ncbi:MAG TPA: glycosyltransferase [Candidatus Omnitrophota bacterium]|nr:glycosyltransferase [Candidatus Omnitrophota bacterium]
MIEDKHKKRRILLMYISRVSGHRQATVAIKKSLKELCPDIQAPTINGFGHAYPLVENIVNRAYMSVIKRTPKVWDYLYDNPKVIRRTESIKNRIYKSSEKKIGPLLERYKPDMVVCTQAFPCGMVAHYKRTHHVALKLIGVLTDFAPHGFWINEGIDYYIVPSEDTKERFMAKGVSEEKIKVYGIPIQPKFTFPVDKKNVGEKLGIDVNIPTILMMGGGQGLGPMASILKSLVKIPLYFQVIVLAGTNKKIIKKIKKISENTNKKILVFDFARNVDELMELSTFIITKTGGMTTAESLAKGLPMVIVNPIPGQEMRNADFLVHKGIGIRINDLHDIEEEVEILLRSPERLSAMRQAAYEHAKPYAALDIAKLILNQPVEESHV